MSDWIEDFVSATEPIRSPSIYRLWGGISCISALLERKVWMEGAKGTLYPNMYVVLVGAPASGKTLVVNECRKVLVPAGVKLAPDNPTRASFLDSLEEAIIPYKLNGFSTYHALAVQNREFRVFFPKSDDTFLADLSNMWDCPPIYTAPRRTTKSVEIEYPVLNILACVTPATLGESPESMWHDGFGARTLFIYGTRVQGYEDPFEQRVDPELIDLKNRATEIYSGFRGQFAWDEDARHLHRRWINEEKFHPVPTHGRLSDYTGRRAVHVMKLSMISSISASHGMEVTAEDYLRARKWLIDAEEVMPDVFMAMTQKSDSQVLQDLHHFAYSMYSKVQREKRVPIKQSILHSWLAERVPSERILPIMKTAESTAKFRRDYQGGGWIPLPLSEA